MITLKRNSLIGIAISISLSVTSLASMAEIVFEENFDDQPDWTSGLDENGHDRVQFASTNTSFPDGWFACYQDPAWAPSVGHNDRHESIEILEINSDKARGGTGKSYVGWRDSYNPGWKYWASDSSLLKYFPEGYNQLYVEFWIRFSPDWTTVAGPGSKLFRISSWSEQNSPFQAFGDTENREGELGPIMLYEWTNSGYGLRNPLAFRGGPHGEGYQMRNEDIPGLPRTLVGTGDLPMNFTQDMKNMGVNQTAPKLPDQINGGYISDNLDQIVSHEQVFGGGTTWTKIAFFVKMNSAPGVNDGIAKQWINDVQVFNNTSINWVKPTDHNTMPKWNVVLIGGNDFFQEYDNELRHEEWYAIDDIRISTAPLIPLIPPPNSPTGVGIE